ncbi:DUF3604 domain-containing protein [Marinihelvus fidelis]|uniref:DUF3604 domain-containing protein n=1 Tax=Marinihelvus fidelis TaxID=2613842 RepID=A0A5N0TG42_9GAMM|nr:DUF3604 domain-containing protein [Marinihelvus fidelis]KAA9134012.1 DUF3604 domain-containing protein [Marinihelvus fidelis]
MRHSKVTSLGALVIMALSACQRDEGSSTQATQSPPPDAEPVTEVTPPASPAEPAETPLPRTAWFGDTHVHTGWSADAGMDGAITGPVDAYRYALGQEVKSNTGLPAKLSRPYDWFMVTDHSDGMGTINEIIAGNPEMLADPMLKGWYDALNSGDEAQAAKAKSELIVAQSTGKLPSQLMDPKWMVSAWEKTVKAAEDFYEPGTFTTFIAYEWTVNANGGDNLHRNVIFKGTGDQALQILPLTTFETEDPEKLWEWMANYEAKTGDRVHAIPHNGNMSNGRMFEESRFDGSPMTSEWAEQRQKYERLYEVTQIKGQSEQHPALAPNDEFASWDLWDRGNLILAPKPDGSFKYEYWRESLKSGMRLEAQLGTNPFKYGANAGTDTHTGLSSTEEDSFFGKFKTLEPSNLERWNFPLLSGPTDEYMGWEMAASGVMGVWATENTREAIWDAMYRRETFATTGPRMSVRLFGGFDLDESDLQGDVVANAYAGGVPMGGDLAGTGGDQAPVFLVQAMKDPQGANLDRVQMIKTWVDADGGQHEQVYELAWSGDRQPGADGKLPPVGSTVNLDTAEYTNSIGSASFTTAWTDPDFDPAQKAAYYVRVLEIPTPRWTLYDKVNLGAEPGPDVPLTHQERAFSSPIWYTP